MCRQCPSTWAGSKPSTSFPVSWPPVGWGSRRPKPACSRHGLCPALRRRAAPAGLHRRRGWVRLPFWRYTVGRRRGYRGGPAEILICQWFGQHKINRIFTDIVAAFACTVWSVGVQAALPAVSANAAIIGALMVLTPGVALTMGVARHPERRLPLWFHSPAGCVCLLRQHCLRRGAGLAGHARIGGGRGTSTPLWTNYLTQFVVAVVATISFGITFHAPKPALSGGRLDRRGGVDGLHPRLTTC